MLTTILVGYNKTGAPSKWLIREIIGNICKACRFTIMTRPNGLQYLATGKELIRDDLTDIHEEEVNLS